MFFILPKATQICELEVNSYTKEQNSDELIQHINPKYSAFSNSVQLATNSFYRPVKQRNSVYHSVQVDRRSPDSVVRQFQRFL